ncbi:MAG: Formate hydrogenlyase subunit 7 [bacterium ADurb.Bin270]|nr:MAG: Formate hydrogenlyase subunit 7 [bacterium ADurb.Bin270]
MLKIIRSRLQQKSWTVAFPDAEPNLPAKFRGMPSIDDSACGKDCGLCVKSCPVGALSCSGEGRISIDLGKCIFCGNCERECGEGVIKFTRDYRLASCVREGLIVGEAEFRLAEKLKKEMLRLFGRSLKLRQISAGGCNACEADINVLSTIVFDLGRFGIQFVASPRHADGILVTGPISNNMALALEKTYAAIPSPKIVIASGACAISGGPFIGHLDVKGGVDKLIPVDLYIPGCPPHPITVLDGFLRLLGRVR